MPEPLAPAFERAMNDPELLALNQDIALFDARLDQLLQLVSGENPGRLWKLALIEWRGLWEATAREDGRDVQRHREELEHILNQGAGEVETWDQVLDVAEQKRKLVETESKRREKMREFIRAEDAGVHFRALNLAVKAHVKDMATLAAIADEFARIIGLTNLSGVEAALVQPGG